jgi:GNAT superfamily N-acetyltransferase
VTTAENIRNLMIHTYDGDSAVLRTDDVIALYADVYREPPYNEGDDDVAAFADGWQRRVGQPGFRLVCADLERDVVGFSFGHQLPRDTRWWQGALDQLPADLTEEWPGRTFAVIELAVRAPYRGQGVGRALHTALLAGRTEERVTLLSLREAEAAQRSYLNWGYRRVGRIRPGEDTPTYDAFVLPLR